MSGRGGGGGRGGGRGGWGGGRGGLSQSKEFLKRSAQEAGLDDRHMKLLSDITKPALFPDILWNATGDGYWDDTEENAISNELIVTKRTPSIFYIMNKQREIIDRMQRSCHYIRPAVTVDVVRYNTTNNYATPADVAVLNAMGMNGKLASDERYFPVELLPHHPSNNLKKKASGSTKRKHGNKLLTNADGIPVLDDFGEEIMDEKGGDGGGDDDGSNDDDEDNNLEIEDDGEEEDGEDYTTNYYESDNDDDGGDDDEPTFD